MADHIVSADKLNSQPYPFSSSTHRHQGCQIPKESLYPWKTQTNSKSVKYNSEKTDYLELGAGMWGGITTEMLIFSEMRYGTWSLKTKFNILGIWSCNSQKVDQFEKQTNKTKKKGRGGGEESTRENFLNFSQVFPPLHFLKKTEWQSCRHRHTLVKSGTTV